MINQVPEDPKPAPDPELVKIIEAMIKAFEPVRDAIVQVGQALAQGLAGVKASGFLDACTRPGCGHLRAVHAKHSGCAAKHYHCTCLGFEEPEVPPS